MARKKRISSHEKRLRKKQFDENKMRKEGKSEDEIQKYLLEKYYDEKNGVLPGKKQIEKREKAIKETESGDRNASYLKKSFQKTASVKKINAQNKHESGEGKGNTRHINSNLSFKSQKRYVSAINSLMKRHNLNTINQINDKIIVAEINRAEELYNDGVFKVADQLNTTLSALKTLKVATENERYDYKKPDISEDIQFYRDMKNTKGIFRTNDDSTYLKANEEEVQEAFKQLQKASEEAKNDFDRHRLEILQERLKTEGLFLTRGAATTNISVNDIKFEEDGSVKVLLYRGKGDKTVFLHEKSPEKVAHISSVVERAKREGLEYPYQLKSEKGELLKLDSSTQAFRKMMTNTVDVTRTIEVEAKRSNSVMKRTGEDKLKTTITANISEHAMRKYGAEREKQELLSFIKQMDIKERSAYKTREIERLDQLEKEGIEFFKERASANDVKNLEKKTAEGPKTKKMYEKLLQRDLNGNTRKTPLEHLPDEQFVHYIVSMKLSHSRLDVIAAYINKG